MFHSTSDFPRTYPRCPQLNQGIIILMVIIVFSIGAMAFVCNCCPLFYISKVNIFQLFKYARIAFTSASLRRSCKGSITLIYIILCVFCWYYRDLVNWVFGYIIRACRISDMTYMPSANGYVILALAFRYLRILIFLVTGELKTASYSGPTFDRR